MPETGDLLFFYIQFIIIWTMFFSEIKFETWNMKPGTWNL